MPVGPPALPEGIRDFKASMRDPGGGLKVLVEGLGTGRSIDVIELKFEVGGETPEVIWLKRGPTTLEVSRDRSRAGLDVSDGRDESGAPEDSPENTPCEPIWIAPMSR